jgi:c-di-GMP-binding flagellar brake protein YcgR
MVRRKKAGMTVEKRKSPRIDLHFQLIYIGRKEERSHEVQDLSIGGLFIKTENPSKFREGDEIELVMREPADNTLMLLDARVMRITKNGIGVEFLDLSPEDERTLETCFDLFRHTLPQFNS